MYCDCDSIAARLERTAVNQMGQGSIPGGGGYPS